MPLGTLDRSPPPFFKQGPSALSKLMVFSALALFLMVADVRFKIIQPLRATLATVLYPVQWLAMRPVLLLRHGGQYFADLETAQTREAEARRKLAPRYAPGRLKQWLAMLTRSYPEAVALFAEIRRENDCARIDALLNPLQPAS